VTSLIWGINIKYIRPKEPITKKPKKRKTINECQKICSNHASKVEKTKIELLIQTANSK
jgi:hypothetical protein